MKTILFDQQLAQATADLSPAEMIELADELERRARQLKHGARCTTTVELSPKVKAALDELQALELCNKKGNAL